MIWRGILILAVLLGCTPAPSESSQRAESFDYPQRQISQCGYLHAAVERLATAQQWQQWAASHGVKSALFDSQVWPVGERRWVIAAGSKPHAGYRVVFDGSENGQLLATVELVGAGEPGRMYAQVITSPCVIVQLPAGGFRRAVLRDDELRGESVLLLD